MAVTTTVPTISNAVALFDRMTSLAAPRTFDKVGFTRERGEGVSGIFYGPDLAGRESGGSLREIPLNAVVKTSVSICTR